MHFKTSCFHVKGKFQKLWTGNCDRQKKRTFPTVDTNLPPLLENRFMHGNVLRNACLICVHTFDLINLALQMY